ncbi:hypothetical protein HQ590_11470, partial [bacterium]|nr:hypothetical protein [bacterium]
MRAIAPRSIASLMDWSLVTRYFVVAVLAHLLFLVGLGRITLALPKLQLPVRFDPPPPGPGGIYIPGSEPILDPPPWEGPPIEPLGRAKAGPAGTTPGTRTGVIETGQLPLTGSDSELIKVDGMPTAPTTWTVAPPGTVRPGPVTGPGTLTGWGTPGGRPGIGTDSIYWGRIDRRPQQGTIAAHPDGRTDKTEAAVTAALRWLQNHQRPDGSWSDGGQAPALSALALLC